MEEQECNEGHSWFSKGIGEQAGEEEEEEVVAGKCWRFEETQSCKEKKKRVNVTENKVKDACDIQAVAGNCGTDDREDGWKDACFQPLKATNPPRWCITIEQWLFKEVTGRLQAAFSLSETLL